MSYLQTVIRNQGDVYHGDIEDTYSYSASTCDSMIQWWLEYLDEKDERTDTREALSKIILLLDRKAELKEQKHRRLRGKLDELREQHAQVLQDQEEMKANSLLQEEAQQRLREKRKAYSLLREKAQQLQEGHRQVLLELDSNCAKERQAREQLEEANSLLQVQLQQSQEECRKVQQEMEQERRQQKQAHSLLIEELQQLHEMNHRVQRGERATPSPLRSVQEGTETEMATQSPSVNEPTDADAPARRQSQCCPELGDKATSRCQERRKTPAQKSRKRSTERGGSSGYDSSASDCSPSRSVSSVVSNHTESIYGASRPRLEHRHGRRTPPQRVNKNPKQEKPRDCESQRTCKLQSMAQQVRRFSPRNKESSIDDYLQQLESCLVDLPHPTRREKLNLVWNTTSKSVHQFIVTRPPKVRGHYERLCQALREEYAKHNGVQRPRPQQLPSQKQCNQDSKKRSPKPKAKHQKSNNTREKDEISQLLLAVQKLLELQQSS